MRFSRSICLFLAVVVAFSSAARGDDAKDSANQSVQIDFGSGGGSVTSGWNNITQPQGSGLLLSGATDSSGKATSVAVRQVDGWAGYNANGFRKKGPYPPSAMGDSFYLQAGTDTDRYPGQAPSRWSHARTAVSVHLLCFADGR